MGVEDPVLDSPDSTTLEPDAQAVVDVNDGAADDASTSSPKPDGDKADLLSVVRSVTDKRDGTADSPAAEDSGDQPADPAAKDAAKPEPKEPDDENFSDVPFHAHPRFKQLVQQRNHYREGARQYEQVQGFLQQNGLSADEAADVLLLRAQMKTDPAAAWKTLKPLVQQLLIDTGEVLPADLQQEVRAGRITKERAVEISRLRAGQQSSQKAAAFQREQSQRNQALQAQQAIQQGVAEWERSTRSRDPDFDAMQEDIQKEVLWLQRRDGMPTTAEGARKMVQSAYDTVRKRVSGQRRQQTAKSPVTGGRVASGQPTASPKSVLDVVRMARSTG